MSCGGQTVSLDIRSDVWASVLACLDSDPGSVLALLQTCKALQHLADHEHVWRSVAAACWQRLAATSRVGYRSYKELVLDGNRMNAALALPLAGSHCTYRFQHPESSFYECRLLQLQWWRTTNSLRLYFDARGEVDLRLPLSSSIAVVRLKHADAAATAAAAGAEGALQLPTAGSAPHDLDAWAERVVVQPPDACQTFVQKNGHFKGVLIWHATKASTILKALLQQEADAEQPQQQQQQQEPPQQHTHQQRSRRSDAWEEWAEWTLEQGQEEQQQGQQQQQHAEHGGGAAGGTRGAVSPALSPASQVSNLLRSCFTSLRGHSSTSGGGGGQLPEQGDVGTSDSLPLARDACCILQAAPLPAAINKQAAGCSTLGASSSRAPPAPAKHCLVFSYACDLNWCHTPHTPDYSITPLVVSEPQPAAAPRSKGSAHGSSPRRAPRHHLQRGRQASWRLQPLPGVEQQLTGRQEGGLVAAWQQLPGASLVQLGELDQALQAEGPEAEAARWSDLPQGVRDRGAAWWV